MARTLAILAAGVVVGLALAELARRDAARTEQRLRAVETVANLEGRDDFDKFGAALDWLAEQGGES